MRAPIGLKIRNLRKSLGLTQVALAGRAGISASYLNLIESDKRRPGATLAAKLATALGQPVDELSGDREERLIADLEEVLADPVMRGFGAGTARALVAENPAAARALVLLHRAYADTGLALEVYSSRLRSDPLFAELLHRVLSHITAVRSSSEILEDVPDLAETERHRFLQTIGRESRAMSDVAETLIAHFDQSASARRSISPTRALDDFLLEEKNYFDSLEQVADSLRLEIAAAGQFDEAALIHWLSNRHDISVVRSGTPSRDNAAGRNQYAFDAARRQMWFLGAATAATRRFQLARLAGELAAGDEIASLVDRERLTSSAAGRLAHRALGAYLAGALVLPYDAFLDLAESCRYDVDFLGQAFGASFEQVAHRLVTLRRPGEQGIPFGFLRSDPAGRLTKHFPLPGLLLPNTGHACPLWAIYAAFRGAGQTVRQIVRFADGGRYLFIAKTVSKRLSTFRDQPFHVSIMLAADIAHAHRTVYADGLDIGDFAADVPVGPSCRLCTRRECAHRQEEAVDLAEAEPPVLGPLVPMPFDLGAPG